MDMNALLISSIVATCVVLYTRFNKTEDKTETGTPSYGKLTIMYIFTFGIVYMLYVLSTDTNDNNQMLDNIKTGDPPF
tara:strand:+ start:251 stop:484 length:234 start_codon:yes stop_codon:yes gene_type:complete